MTDEQFEERMFEYLKDNLRIETSKEYDYGYGGESYTYTKVELYLGYNLISSATI